MLLKKEFGRASELTTFCNYTALTTILKIIDVLMVPEEKGHHGHIYRCLIASEEDTKEKVTITCYASTHNLSIQESLHYIWVCKHFYDIEQELRLNSSSRLCRASTPEPKSANCLFMLSSIHTSLLLPIHRLTVDIVSIS